MTRPSSLLTFCGLYPCRNRVCHAAAHGHQPRVRVGDVPLRRLPPVLPVLAARRGRPRPGGRRGAGPLEFGAGLPPRQYSCAGTGRAPPARRRPEATASALAAAFAWYAAVSRATFASARATSAAAGRRPGCGAPASAASRLPSAAARSAASRARRSASSDASAASTRSARVCGSPGSSSSPRFPRPNRASSSASAAGCRAARRAASFRSPSSVRFASFDALAATFVPSSATVAT